MGTEAVIVHLDHNRNAFKKGTNWKAQILPTGVTTFTCILLLVRLRTPLQAPQTKPMNIQGLDRATYVEYKLDKCPVSCPT